MKYYTKSGREISFFGAGKREDIDKFFGILLKSWVKRSAYPDSQDDSAYDFANDPSYGQCTVTSMVVQDKFGGTIHRVKVNGGGTHYFNKIDGEYFDLTSDQFTLYNTPLEYEPNEEMDRDHVGTNVNTKMRYEILRMNVEANLAK